MVWLHYKHKPTDRFSVDTINSNRAFQEVSLCAYHIHKFCIYILGYQQLFVPIADKENSWPSEKSEATRGREKYWWIQPAFQRSQLDEKSPRQGIWKGRYILFLRPQGNLTLNHFIFNAGFWLLIRHVQSLKFELF